MVVFKLLPIFAPLIWWFFVLRHRNLETRCLRAEILLVLAPFVVPVLLLIVYSITQ